MPSAPGLVTPALLLVAFVLAACGDTLVDHRADLQQPAGCFPGTATACGPACEDCSPSVVPPAGARVACLPDPGGLSRSACGWECTGGLLKCTQGCCPAASLAAGAAHTCAITTSGSLYCWGENEEGQVTGTPAADVLVPRKWIESGVTAVTAGEGHTCAAVGGEVRCWGRGFASPWSTIAAAAGATALAAGGQHTCAITVGGAVRCWGSGDAVGGGTPVAAGATALAAGRDHTCAVVTGEVRCWGSRALGQLGDGSTVGSSATPVTVPGLAGIDLLAAGDAHTCATAAAPTAGDLSDALQCWGDAPRTPFVPDDVQTTPAIPTRTGGTRSIVPDRVARIDSGRTHICFQRAGAAQSIQCLGPENGSGQLGGIPEPGREVDLAATPGATALAAGGDHACTVLAGAVFCWGLNASGQLGDGSATTPQVGFLVQVSGR